MATTTKSQRKKPAKSTKAARATKKTVTKKTNSTKAKGSAAASAAKATKAASVKSAAKKVLTPLERLRSMHLSLALVYLVFAGIVIGFVETLAKPITLGIQTRDDFASDFTGSVVLGPAYEVVCNIEPKYLLVGSLVVGALASALLATKLRSRYEKTLAARISGFRWLAIGLSGSLMLSYISLLAGIHDTSLIKLSAGLIILTVVFSWIAERDNAKAGGPKWLAYGAGLFAGALAWLPIVVSLVGTSLYGMERFGWHVYAIAGVTLLGFTGFAINQYLQIRPKGTKKEYVAVESSYLQIDLFTKFLVVLITVIALQ